MNLDIRQHDRDENLFQMTAMIDVVFILLSFFVLSVQFHGGEGDLSVSHADRPEMHGAAEEDFPPQVLVRLEATEAGGVAILVGERRLRDDSFDQITSALAAIDMPQIPVVLAADPSLSVQQVARALDAVLASPMTRVALGPLPEPR